jgi:UDP-N-acetylglucosamine 2-epimerase (non-hydrolysing)
MYKIISVVGARPNFMKVAPINRAFEEIKDCEHIIVHTGQHYDKNMSDSFFEDLDIAHPKYFLGVGSGTHSQQTANVMVEFEKVLDIENPDMVIVVGDVNSTLACTLTSVKKNIPVSHVEAGLRSFDRSMPEEINRMATDAICNYAFVSEPSGLYYLKRENFPEQNTFYVGNTMIDSQHYGIEWLNKNPELKSELPEKEYALITIHRPSNVDFEEQLKMLVDVLDNFSKNIHLVFPVHPRTEKNLEKFNLKERIFNNPNISVYSPLNYLRFLNLMRNAKVIVTDSGGIQEETTALQIPCITLRNSTERPITVEIGTNELVVPKRELIEDALKRVLNGNFKKGRVPELWDGKAAFRIRDIILEILKNKIK